MRRILFWGAVAVAVLALGVQKTYVYFTNLTPTRMTCKQFIESRPSAKWVELTDSVIDYAGAIQLQSRVLKIDKGTFVPVRPVGERGRAHILLKMKTEDAEAGVLRALVSAETPAPSTPGGKTTQPHANKVMGLVEFGMDTDRKVRRALEDEVSSGSLARDYVIIDNGAAPEAGDAVVGSALVVGALVGAWFLLKSGRKTTAATAGGAAAPRDAQCVRMRDENRDSSGIS